MGYEGLNNENIEADSAQETSNFQEMLISRELQENDLIIPEDGTEKAKDILRAERIPFELNQYTKGIKDKLGGKAPAEYLLTIHDSQNPTQPAGSEAIRTAFELMRQGEVTVRYGKTPSSDQ